MKTSWLKRSVVGLALAFLAGCGGGATSTATNPTLANDDSVEPAERPYYDAGKPFYVAIAAKDYDRAREMLSSHAQLSPQQFSDAMAKVEKQFGRPKALESLHVSSMDPAVLTRSNKGDFAALEVDMAIGAMPNTIPHSIRKASLRGQIVIQLSDSELEKIAKQHETSVAELQKDEDFKPYLNLLVVLVEESGTLKVGYFEFREPSMLD